MSINALNLAEFKQDFTVSTSDKLLYGEIYSPFSLIKNMLNLFDSQVFSNKEAKWLDTGAGTGYFSMVLFDYLNKGLITVILDEEERKNHIIEKMLYLIELKPENVAILKTRFGEKANIISGDFLNYTYDITFDFIIGNPPYNANGMKKVPTNTKRQKKQDGETTWIYFIQKALTLLKSEIGQLCYIVPSIWLKPDKAGVYKLLTHYKIEKLHCLTNTETNKLFKGAAQTPTCYFLLTNIEIGANTRQINLYDKTTELYVNYPYTIGNPLPLFGQTIVKKLRPFLLTAGPLKVIKTNMPSKNTIFSNTYDPINTPYSNIKTCHLNGVKPELVLNYSSSPQAYAKEPKLVLAHKMYGFPFWDEAGTYGISNRDNYIILKQNKTLAELKQIQAFLSSNFALYIYEATRYRMKYLEKYAFELLPDINKLPNFPPAEEINDVTIATYFGLSTEDIKHIQGLHKRHAYEWFI